VRLGILTAAKNVLSSLEIGADIIIAPNITWIESARAPLIQICEGGSTYPAQHPLREILTLTIGIFVRIRKDYAQYYEQALQDETRSIFGIRDTIVAALEGNNLTNQLTVPLYLAGESGVQTRQGYPGLLLKMLSFNAERITSRSNPNGN